MPMEATLKAAPAVSRAIPGLPPGPRMPRALQTAIWSRRAQWMLEQSRARFGDMFTLQIAYEGTWVMVSDPELVKQVFTGDPRVFHAGEGNQILRPFLGDNSVLVLDEKQHIGQRRLLLPPFHGERMKGYEQKMSEIAGREIDSWPTGVPYKLRPRMQAITLEIILETVFGVHGGERMDPLRDALREFLDLTTNPRVLGPVLLVGPDHVRRVPAFRRRIERVDELIHREIAERRAAEDLEQRDDVLSLLVAARPADGDLVAPRAVDARAEPRPLRRHVHPSDRLRRHLGDGLRSRAGEAGLHR
jgi:cytochrome P450